MKILCKIIGHNYVFRHEWIPSIDARVVKMAYAYARCKRCGKREYIKIYDSKETSNKP